MPTFTRQQALRDLDEKNAKQMLRIARETSTSDTPIKSARGATPAGDEQRLRGIPAIGRGVAGHIPGTRP